MSLYKKTEHLLYDFKNMKTEIKNLELEIEFLNKNVEGIGAIGYDEKTQSTNKFSSVVENEVIHREKIGYSDKIKHLEYVKEEKKLIINKINNTFEETLTKYEFNIIDMYYFKRRKAKDIAITLDMSESTLYRTKSILINKIASIIFN